MKKLKERISIQIIKNPRASILIGIILLNVVFLLISTGIINFLTRDTLGDVGFAQTLYYTICMILDAGTIEQVITDFGSASAVLVIICLITILVGMITFTGATIGYVTNYISEFIDKANVNTRPIHISNHVVILNWNSRASEIINDMLYLDTKETVVVLVKSNADSVEREIYERIYLTMQREKGLKNKLTIIVREGSTYSMKQLNDIALKDAKTVIILGDNDYDSTCKYEQVEATQKRGNANTIKTLVQVAEITSQDSSLDNQRIIVEVENAWTEKVARRIIAHKENLGKCNIVPVAVNRVLGQMLSQFCIFPELNRVYSDLFSNKGAEFFCALAPEHSEQSEEELIRQILYENNKVIPLSFLESKTGRCLYYMGMEEKDIHYSTKISPHKIDLEINPNFWLKKRNVVILGHNSKLEDIMAGFESFRDEWNRPEEEILNIIVIDDKRGLERMNYYQAYSYVNQVIEAEIYDTELILSSINRFVDANEEDTSILILSDDTVPEQDIDSTALMHLVYVQDIIFERIRKNPNFDRDSIDIIVEIINPKNYDVVHNYNIENIVISNRYISKMITQVGEKIELFEFYEDILAYDTATATCFESKELYAKKVDEFFRRIPEPCTAEELIRAVYDATPVDNRAIVLGIARPGNRLELFGEQKSESLVKLEKDDKLIIYSNH